MLSDGLQERADYIARLGLNAPFGARCFLTLQQLQLGLQERGRLNAPFGARCFLTLRYLFKFDTELGLNAPFGARCFLT